MEAASSFQSRHRAVRPSVTLMQHSPNPHPGKHGDNYGMGTGHDQTASSGTLCDLLDQATFVMLFGEIPFRSGKECWTGRCQNNILHGRVHASRSDSHPSLLTGHRAVALSYPYGLWLPCIRYDWWPDW
jgi:hypothetical protein